MSDLDDKVDRWDHEHLQEQVWELQAQLDKLQEDFEKLRDILTGDGK